MTLDAAWVEVMDILYPLNWDAEYGEAEVIPTDGSADLTLIAHDREHYTASVVIIGDRSRHPMGMPRLTRQQAHGRAPDEALRALAAKLREASK